MTALDARVSVGLYTHPKIKKLIRRIGFEGPWRLVGLWLYARQHKPDGLLEGMSDEDIEIAVDWAGKPGELVAALLEVGFLDRCVDNPYYALHDWADHQPWSAGTLERSAKAKYRALKRHHGEERARQMMGELFHVDPAQGTENDAQRNAPRMRDAQAVHAPRNAPSPSPSPSPLPSAALSPADWIPADAWQDFVDHRKAKRAPMTPKSVKLIVAKLAEYRQQGVPPKTVLEYAIEQGHTGLYYKPARGPVANSNGHEQEPAAKSWGEVHAALRAGRAPAQWCDARTATALDAIGGWAAVKGMSGRDLEFKQKTFLAAFNAGAH